MGTWGAKSLKDDKIVAMAAAINELKGQLKLTPQLAAAAANKDKDKDKRGKRGQKGKNKKNRYNRAKQKKDKARKKIPPKDGEKKEKTHDGRTYYWCIHHMAWTMHSPKLCLLGREQKGEDKVVKSATVATAATNPMYEALLSTLARMQDEEE
jgi:hypothetical protein